MSGKKAGGKVEGGKAKIEMISERRHLPLSNSMIFGQPDRVYVDVCTACSAIIFDSTAHYEWHRMIGR